MRSNHILFINNEISIMTITRLRNRFLQHGSDKNEKFANKETSAFHFWESLKRTISQC